MKGLARLPAPETPQVLENPEKPKQPMPKRALWAKRSASVSPSHTAKRLGYWRPRISGKERKNAFSLTVYHGHKELLYRMWKEKPEYKQRVSEAPEGERMGVLRKIVAELGFSLPKGQEEVRLLNKARRGPKKEK